jgi:putative tricarboxylic transport membrane protein
VLILYAELLPVIGFVIATVFAAAYLSWRLGSSVIGALLTGLGTSVGIYVVFHLVLGLSLARGPFGF